MANENDIHGLPGDEDVDLESLDASFVPTPPLSIEQFANLIHNALDAMRHNASISDSMLTEREWMEYLEDALGEQD